MPKKKGYEEWGIYLLIAIVGLIYYHTSTLRAKYGWFNDGKWIFINSVFYVLFFGLLSGVVIGKIVKRFRG